MNNTSLSPAEKQARTMGLRLLGSVVVLGGLLATIGVAQDNWANSKEGRDSARRTSCIAELRSTLRDPWSLQVHGTSSDGRRLDYSAKNGFGGRVRETYYC